MLTLTEDAATVLARSRSQQGIADNAVLRVAPGENQDLSVGFVDEPLNGDHTGSAHGMPICVAPEVAEALESTQIDVDTSGDGPQLVLVPAG